MKTDREFTGTLTGFDDFVSTYIAVLLTPTKFADQFGHPDMVLEDVTE